MNTTLEKVTEKVLKRVREKYIRSTVSGKLLFLIIYEEGTDMVEGGNISESINSRSFYISTQSLDYKSNFLSSKNLGEKARQERTKKVIVVLIIPCRI